MEFFFPPMTRNSVKGDCEKSLTRNAAAEFIWKFWDEVIVDAIFQRTQNNNWSCVTNFLLLDSFVGENWFVRTTWKEVNL